MDADHDALLSRSSAETGKISFQEFSGKAGSTKVVPEEGVSRGDGGERRVARNPRGRGRAHKVSTVLEDGASGGDERACGFARASQAIRLLSMPLPHG